MWVGRPVRRPPTSHGGALPARVLLGSALLELEPDEALPADDLSIVPGLDHIRVTGSISTTVPSSCVTRIVPDWATPTCLC